MFKQSARLFYQPFYKPGIPFPPSTASQYSRAKCLQNYSTIWAQRMENIKSRESYALVDSGLKFTHYSCERKKHREQKRVGGVRGGHSFPACWPFVLGQASDGFCAAYCWAWNSAAFQICVHLRGRNESISGVCCVFRWLSLKC